MNISIALADYLDYERPFRGEPYVDPPNAIRTTRGLFDWDDIERATLESILQQKEGRL